LLLGRAGRWVVCGDAMLLVFLAATGWSLWWPGLARIRRALRLPRPGATGAKLFYWHRTVGIAVSSLILPSAVTGFMLTIGAFLAQPQSNVASPPIQATSTDERIALARSLFPGLVVREVRFDNASGALKRVVLREPGAGLRAPITDLEFVPATGHVATIVDRHRLSGYARLASWAFPIHSAQIGGAVLRCLLLSTALAGATLAVLGLALWVSRRARGPAFQATSDGSKG
jgi:uncharacterized iron-regulated membrane protein